MKDDSRWWEEKKSKSKNERDEKMTHAKILAKQNEKFSLRKKKHQNG